MIRKRVGEEFWLITQPDHARLAGTIARAIGNRQFSGTTRPAVYEAIDAHDDGWAEADARPTLDGSGRPADVFDMARAIEHSAWLKSAERAVTRDPYGGLLVALHSLSLSAMAAGAMPAGITDDAQRRRQFDLNKIQHSLIELAEGLRANLKLTVDRPLRLGLADGWTNPAEEQLRFDLRLLQAADALSLHLCCDHVPSAVVPQPHPRPGAAAVTLRPRHAADGVLIVQPWPFAGPVVRVTVPYRAVPVLACADPRRLNDAWDRATPKLAVGELRAG